MGGIDYFALISLEILMPTSIGSSRVWAWAASREERSQRRDLAPIFDISNLSNLSRYNNIILPSCKVLIQLNVSGCMLYVLPLQDCDFPFDYN